MQCEVTPSRRSPQLALLIVVSLAVMAITGSFVKQQGELDRQADAIRAIRRDLTPPSPQWMGNHPDVGADLVRVVHELVVDSACRVEFGATHEVGIVTLALGAAACGIVLDPTLPGHSCSVGPLEAATDQPYTVTIAGDLLTVTRSNLQVGATRRFAFVCTPGK